MLCFITLRSISGNRARCYAVNLAEGATSRPFVGAKLRCALLTLGVFSLIRATVAFTAGVSFQSITRRVSELDALPERRARCIYPVHDRSGTKQLRLRSDA